MTRTRLSLLAASASLVLWALGTIPTYAATVAPSAAAVQRSLLTPSQMAALTGYRGALFPDGDALGGCEDLPDGFWCARALTPSDYRRISPAYVTVTVYPSRAAARLWIAEATAQAKVSTITEGALISATPTEVDAIVRVGAVRDAQDSIITPSLTSVTVDLLVGRLVVSGTTVVETSRASKEALVRSARALAKGQAARVPRT